MGHQRHQAAWKWTAAVPWPVCDSDDFLFFKFCLKIPKNKSIDCCSVLLLIGGFAMGVACAGATDAVCRRVGRRVGGRLSAWNGPAPAGRCCWCRRADDGRRVTMKRNQCRRFWWFSGCGPPFGLPTLKTSCRVPRPLVVWWVAVTTDDPLPLFRRLNVVLVDVNVVVAGKITNFLIVRRRVRRRRALGVCLLFFFFFNFFFVCFECVGV